MILPATAFPEKTGTFTNTDRRVQLGRQALAPPGEARQDWEIIQELARRLGLDWHYGHPRDVFAEMTPGDAVAARDHLGPTRARGRRDLSVRLRGPSPGTSVIFGDGFPTPSGRGKLVPAAVVPARRGARRPIPDGPDHRPAARALAHRRDDPARHACSTRSSPRRSPTSRPASCTGWASTPGDPVRVTTRRGSIELAARADRDVPPGLVFIPFCYAEAAANLLTNPALDPFGKIPEFKFCAARLEKVEEHLSSAL